MHFIDPMFFRIGKIGLTEKKCFRIIMKGITRQREIENLCKALANQKFHNIFMDSRILQCNEDECRPKLPYPFLRDCGWCIDGTIEQISPLCCIDIEKGKDRYSPRPQGMKELYTTHTAPIEHNRNGIIQEKCGRPHFHPSLSLHIDSYESAPTFSQS